MKDKLSYSQLYTELESLNTSAYDSVFNGDFEGFQETIDEFINSGIMEQEEFASAREAYRYSSMPFTLDGMWISVDSRNPLDKPITDFSGLPIQELHKRDVQPFYAYLTEQEKPKEDSKIAGKRIDAFNTYVELYKNLYKDPSPKNIFTVPLVDNLSKHQMIYINRVTELAAARSKFYMTCDFTCLPVNGIKIIDNAKLRKLDNTLDKIKYLTKAFDNLYDPVINKNKFTIKDCFSFNGYKKVIASNYIQGKQIDRKNWKNYRKGSLPKIPEFYLQLAFYLTIPSSAEIEKFVNLHGYSIKSPMTQFGNICIGENPILHRDLCRWIDAGIDYNLINEICKFDLEKPEVRKPKAK